MGISTNIKGDVIGDYLLTLKEKDCEVLLTICEELGIVFPEGPEWTLNALLLQIACGELVVSRPSLTDNVIRHLDIVCYDERIDAREGRVGGDYPV